MGGLVCTRLGDFCEFIALVAGGIGCDKGLRPVLIASPLFALPRMRGFRELELFRCNPAQKQRLRLQ